MTFRTCSLAVAAMLACTLCVNAQTANNYIRSIEGPPWGQNTNEASMDEVFGVGQWSDLTYETVDPAALFDAGSRFIFMEGGDFNAENLQTFLTNNAAAINSWVNSGGRLFLNAAPNEGGTIVTPFAGTTINYPDFSVDPTTAFDPNHPIFQGPAVPVTTSYTGNSFAHATVTNPGGTTLMVSGGGSLIHLSERSIGFGLLVIGGLTTDNFHQPQPDAHNLRTNIVAYASSGSPTSPPVSYCTAKPNGIGCIPAIGWEGHPSGANSGFTVSSTNVRNQKVGVLLYTLDGRDVMPFQGGYLCLASPIRRTPGRNSNGSHYLVVDCSGGWRIDMNAFAAGAIGGQPAAGLHRPGSSVHCQWWGRDPGDPFGSALTDALQYEIAP
jgi:hypothetical protein